MTQSTPRPARRSRPRPAPRLSAWRAALSPALLALPALLAGAPVQAEVRFITTDLGTLGGTSSSANGINAAGVVVGTSTLANGTSSGFVWQACALRALGYGSTTAAAINDAGQVVGTSGGHALLVDAAGTGYDLGTLGGAASIASAINAAGVVVGSGETNGSNYFHATSWQLGRPVIDLGTLTGSNAAFSQANGINAAGRAVGFSTSAAGSFQAALWQSGSISYLGGLSGASTSSANGINATGQVVGQSVDATSFVSKAVLWQNGSIQNLGSLGGTSSSASAINDAGLIVGRSTNGSGSARGFLRTGRGDMQDLNTLLVAGSTATVTTATAINANGQIAGTATFAGQSHAVLLTPTGSVTWQGSGSGGSFNSAANWEQGFGTSALLDASTAPTGTLTGDGTIRANLSNLGTLTAANVTITGSFTNAGLVNGSGIVNASLNNSASGQVQVSFGGATVYGPVTTTAGGAVILSGKSESTLYGAVDVKSGGELRVSAGSTGVFFGQVNQRTGSVCSGTGTKFYEGGLSIGNSPGLGVDKYIVAGNLGFGGTLKVVAWNGFTFAAGQHFDIFDWGSSTGTFAAIDLSGAVLAAGRGAEPWH